uniref:hypothetical protein n=1 Tax=Pedobacter schmidteae TaxID=2201271 RepID=UPI000EAD7051|nr:hypothetical protein [Pedobacter schmidteae]
MKNVTFITTGQPSTNPRLVKEVQTLQQQGYQVKVICCFYQSWAQEFDKDIIDKNPGLYIYCGGDPVRYKTRYFFSRLRQKLGLLFLRHLKLKFFAEIGISRCHPEALSIAKKIKTDLYIAHNLGALPAAAIAARRTGAQLGFDAEDFHRNDVSNQPEDFDVRLKTHIENKYIPQVAYLTASSPAISEAYHTLYPGKKPVCILNVFNKTKTSPEEVDAHTTGPIRLFWFSQTVGINRGLENLVLALKSMKNSPFELHLLGNCSKQFKAELSREVKQIYFYPPLPPQEIFSFAIQFDIGMALEPAFSRNNDLALSNKLFTYMQAGLAIIASNTTAQAAFLNTYPQIGQLYKINAVSSLSEALLHYAQHRNELLTAKRAALKLAQTSLNWENEELKFLEVIKQTLHLEH